jgi:hypothetical protein
MSSKMARERQRHVRERIRDTAPSGEIHLASACCIACNADHHRKISEIGGMNTQQYLEPIVVCSALCHQTRPEPAESWTNPRAVRRRCCHRRAHAGRQRRRERQWRRERHAHRDWHASASMFLVAVWAVCLASIDQGRRCLLSSGEVEKVDVVLPIQTRGLFARNWSHDLAEAQRGRSGGYFRRVKPREQQLARGQGEGIRGISA